MTLPTTTIIPTTNPSVSSTKLRFARRFLRSLSKIRKTGPSSSSSVCDVKKRGEGLKMAAYWCMARAAGSRRAWSRAVLVKLSQMKRRMRGKRRSKWLLLGKTRTKKKKKIVTCSYDDDEEEVLMKRQTEKLREMVPGGKLMDICSLLEETAHFVTCLSAQVHVMQTIANHYS